MFDHEIPARINALSDAMLAKGLVRPDAAIVLIANSSTWTVNVSWAKAAFTEKDRHYSHNDQEHFHASHEDLGKALDAVDAHIAALPSREEAKLKHFMSALGDIIDMGRANNIEVDFVNPLVETMKRLSENALTFQAAAE